MQSDQEMNTPISRSQSEHATNSSSGAERLRSGEHTDEDMVKAAQTQMVVATLITTIAFAAGFAIPGSYETNADQPQPKGAPILLKHASFHAFLITNTLSFACSLASIFTYIVLSEEALLYRRSKVIDKLYDFAGYLLLVALVAIAVAFVTGLYSILAHSTTIAVVVTVCGLIYFPLILYVVCVFCNGEFPLSTSTRDKT